MRKFHSEPASAGYTFKRTLKKTGRYKIVCTLHEEMTHDDHRAPLGLAAMPSGAAGTFAAVARLTACPSCDSPYLQPMRCEVQDDDSVQVELRCTDCMTVLQVPFTREEMEELDRSEAACREQIVAEYERTVSESMEALAAVLVPALEQDLLGADDFAPPPRERRVR